MIDYEGEVHYRVKWVGYSSYYNALLASTEFKDSTIDAYYDFRAGGGTRPMPLDADGEGPSSASDTDSNATEEYYVAEEDLPEYDPVAEQRRAAYASQFKSRDEILAVVRRRQKYGTHNARKIILEEFVGQRLRPGHSYIMIFLEEEHHYVIVVYKGYLFIVDGANCIFNEPDRVAKIRERVTHRHFKLMRYEYQTGELHCSSSAALIMIEFMRLIGKRTPPNRFGDSIDVPTDQRRKLNLRFYRTEASPRSIHGFRTVDQVVRNKTCIFCRQTFRTMQSKRNHETHCPQIEQVSDDRSSEEEQLPPLPPRRQQGPRGRGRRARRRAP